MTVEMNSLEVNLYIYFFKLQPHFFYERFPILFKEFVILK